MNKTTKIFTFIGGGIGIVLVSVFATLGIQKMHISFDAPSPPVVAVPVPAPAPAVQVAQVIAVAPHFEMVSKPSRHCYPTENVVYTPQEQGPPVAGALIGGLTGGLLGSTAHGSNRDLAIGGGAVLGAVTGGLIQHNMQQQQYVPEVQYSSHCVTRMVSTQVRKGYDVTYLYNGQQGVVRMENAPVVNSLIAPPGMSLNVSATNQKE